MHLTYIIASPVSGLKDDPWGWLRWIKVEIRASLHDVEAISLGNPELARVVCHGVLSVHDRVDGPP